jgi:hypothetical protein
MGSHVSVLVHEYKQRRRPGRREKLTKPQSNPGGLPSFPRDRRGSRLLDSTTLYESKRTFQEFPSSNTGAPNWQEDVCRAESRPEPEAPRNCDRLRAYQRLHGTGRKKHSNVTDRPKSCKSHSAAVTNIPLILRRKSTSAAASGSLFSRRLRRIRRHSMPAASPTPTPDIALEVDRQDCMTPSGYSVLGGFKRGSLRITNGVASPTPSSAPNSPALRPVLSDNARHVCHSPLSRDAEDHIQDSFVDDVMAGASPAPAIHPRHSIRLVTPSLYAPSRSGSSFSSLGAPILRHGDALHNDIYELPLSAPAFLNGTEPTVYPHQRPQITSDVGLDLLLRDHRLPDPEIDTSSLQIAHSSGDFTPANWVPRNYERPFCTPSPLSATTDSGYSSTDTAHSWWTCPSYPVSQGDGHVWPPTAAVGPCEDSESHRRDVGCDDCAISAALSVLGGCVSKSPPPIPARGDAQWSFGPLFSQESIHSVKQPGPLRRRHSSATCGPRVDSYCNSVLDNRDPMVSGGLVNISGQDYYQRFSRTYSVARAERRKVEWDS